MAKQSLCKLSTNDGRDPVKVIVAVEHAFQIQPSDRMWAGNLVKSRILERTSRGVDCNEKPFAPYNKTRPYTWYPYGRQGKKSKEISAKSKRAAVGRFKRAIGSGTKTASGLGLKFASYDAFKKSLGRITVDLRGPRAPHMLQAVIVKVDGELVTVGIYGAEADRASGHNDGINKSLPKREFMGSNATDHSLMTEGIKERAFWRANAVLGII